jgi:hypothetical protein
MVTACSSRVTHLQLRHCIKQLLQAFRLISQRLQLRDVHLTLQLLPQRLQLMHLQQHQQQDTQYALVHRAQHQLP